MKIDVDEADLANQDNKIYQKLIDRSKSLPFDLKLDSAEAMFEQIATEQLVLKQRQMRRRHPEKMRRHLMVRILLLKIPL
jgi:hypothetical protein